MKLPKMFSMNTIQRTHSFEALIRNVSRDVRTEPSDAKIAERYNTSVEFVRRQRKFCAPRPPVQPQQLERGIFAKEDCMQQSKPKRKMSPETRAKISESHKKRRAKNRENEQMIESLSDTIKRQQNTIMRLLAIGRIREKRNWWQRLRNKQISPHDVDREIEENEERHNAIINAANSEG